MQEGAKRSGGCIRWYEYGCLAGMLLLLALAITFTVYWRRIEIDELAQTYADVIEATRAEADALKRHLLERYPGEAIAVRMQLSTVRRSDETTLTFVIQMVDPHFPASDGGPDLEDAAFAIAADALDQCAVLAQYDLLRVEFAERNAATEKVKTTADFTFEVGELLHAPDSER